MTVVPTFAIRRPRLERLLDERGERPLVVVRGPAGAGKTVLVAQWLQARGEPYTWLTVDASVDEDPEVLRRALAPPDGRTTIVLDGVDRLRDPAARRVVARLVEQPSPARLVLIGRALPLVGLERARLRGDVGEVGPAALAFRRSEIAEWAATWANGAPAVRDLEAATLGWPAGLRLAQLEGRPGAGGASPLHEPGGVTPDYVREELIDGSPPELRDFLAVTCWLPVLTRPVCEAVLADGTCRVPLALADIERLPLFPVAGRPGAYRYPPLLAEVLRQEHCRRDGARATTARVGAAEACRRAGETETAIELLLAAGCEAAAAEVCAELAARDEAPLRRIDDLLRRQDGPRWLPWRVRAAVAAGRVDEAGSLLDLADDDDDAALLMARAAVAERVGDVAGLLAAADRLLAAGGPPPPKAHGWRVRALLWSGDVVAARRALDETAGTDATLARAWVAWWDGDVACAARLIDAAARTAAETGPELLFLDGAVRRERNHTAGAVALLQEARVRAGEQGHVVVAALAASELARCHRAARASIEALELVVSARSAHPDLPPGVAAQLRTTEARVRLDRDDVAGAAAAAAGANGDDGLLAVRVALREAPARAGELLAAVDPDTPRQAVEARLLRAQIPGSDPTEVATALCRAIADGEPRGLVRTFLDEGPELRRWLPELVLASADRSLGRIAALASQELAQAPAGDWRPPVEQLTARELVVLRMLPLRMSNREMAAQMYISVNTLKTHVRAIYRKLEVPHRSAAVRRAKALELV